MTRPISFYLNFASARKKTPTGALKELPYGSLKTLVFARADMAARAFLGFLGSFAGYIACAAKAGMPKAVSVIQIAIAIIIRFSVSETKPKGTLLDPPTQAHFSSRLSI